MFLIFFKSNFFDELINAFKSLFAEKDLYFGDSKLK